MGKDKSKTNQFYNAGNAFQQAQLASRQQSLQDQYEFALMQEYYRQQAAKNLGKRILSQTKVNPAPIDDYELAKPTISTQDKTKVAKQYTKSEVQKNKDDYDALQEYLNSDEYKIAEAIRLSQERPQTTIGNPNNPTKSYYAYEQDLKRAIQLDEMEKYKEEQRKINEGTVNMMFQLPFWVSAPEVMAAYTGLNTAGYAFSDGEQNTAQIVNEQLGLNENSIIGDLVVGGVGGFGSGVVRGGVNGLRNFTRSLAGNTAAEDIGRTVASQDIDAISSNVARTGRITSEVRQDFTRAYNQYMNTGNFNKSVRLTDDFGNPIRANEPFAADASKIGKKSGNKRLREIEEQSKAKDARIKELEEQLKQRQNNTVEEPVKESASKPIEEPSSSTTTENVITEQSSNKKPWITRAWNATKNTVKKQFNEGDANTDKLSTKDKLKLAADITWNPAKTIMRLTNHTPGKIAKNIDRSYKFLQIVKSSTEFASMKQEADQLEAMGKHDEANRVRRRFWEMIALNYLPALKGTGKGGWQKSVEHVVGDGGRVSNWVLPTRLLMAPASVNNAIHASKFDFNTAIDNEAKNTNMQYYYDNFIPVDDADTNNDTTKINEYEQGYSFLDY